MTQDNKHHLYSIYIGGAKKKIKKYYCKQCDYVFNTNKHPEGAL